MLLKMKKTAHFVLRQLNALSESLKDEQSNTWLLLISSMSSSSSCIHATVGMILEVMSCCNSENINQLCYDKGKMELTMSSKLGMPQYSGYIIWHCPMHPTDG
jgi:hypothetical protein